MSRKAASANSRIFYGWFVVIAAFAVTFVGFGCAYRFSAFVEPLQRNSGPRAARYRWYFRRRISLFRARGREWSPRRSLWLPPLRGCRHDPDRSWPRCRERRAHSAGDIRSLRTGCGPRRRLRLCSCDRRGPAMVRPPSRLCVRSRRQWYWRRDAADAATGIVFELGPGMACRISGARHSRRRHRRRAGILDRERSSMPRPRARRRSTAVGRSRRSLKAARSVTRSDRVALSAFTPAA